MLLALLLSVSVQAQALTADSTALRISYDDFKKLYDAGEVLVLDTRGEQSYRVGHIAGARWLPLDRVEANIPDLKKEKRALVTYCS
jgi:rhodanese-related sulfurtransferase